MLKIQTLLILICSDLSVMLSKETYFYLQSALKRSLVYERLIMYKHRKFRNTTVTKWNAFLLVYCMKTELLIKHTIFKSLQTLLISKRNSDWDFPQLNLDILLDNCI